MRVRLVSWNVNGLRAVSQKEGWQRFMSQDVDVIGLQETKASTDQLKPELVQPEGWHTCWASSTVKKGYSGTAALSRMEPLSMSRELPDAAWQGEGRIVHMEFDAFHFINGYFPNGGSEILSEEGKHVGLFKRLDYKMGFFRSFLSWVEELRKTKPVVVCGDFNIAHRPIDLARPKANVLNTGFLEVERAFLDEFTALGWIDTFRHVHGDKEGSYSWWSYKSQARARNIGWRIDYFFVSDGLRDAVADAWIDAEQLGSDHCPVGLALEV